MTANRKFRKAFSERNLLKIYKERIKESGAIGIDRVRPAKLEPLIKSEVNLFLKRFNLVAISSPPIKRN